MKHVLVTGAGGFVGGHVAGYLHERGHSVTATVRGVRPADLARHQGLEFRTFDMAGPQPFEPAGVVDAVIHCASALPSTVADPDLLYRTNVEGMARLLEGALKAGATTFVNCSSMSVYGRISVATVDAATPPSEPDAYGRSKRRCEVLLDEAASDGALAALSLRLPGVVGRGSHDNFLSNVMARIKSGAPVEARNPEARFNNIVHVADLAGFVADLVDGLAPGHQAIPLAADAPIPIRRVISLLYEEAGLPENVTYATGGSPFLIDPEPARTLGFDVPTTESSVRRFARDCLA